MVSGSSRQINEQSPVKRPKPNSCSRQDSKMCKLTTHRQFKSIGLFLVLGMTIGAQASCPQQSMTSFERISGVTVKNYPLTLLYTAPNVSSQFGGSSSLADMKRQLTGQFQSIPITAECNNRCRRNVYCRAFLVDYGRHTCYSIESRPLGPLGFTSGGQSSSNKPPIQLEPTPNRTSYFEKICLKLPAIECEKAWVFERVIGFHLHGYDDKVIENVPSRTDCQELCLNELEFRCRSGEYDYETLQCRLSMVDRHIKPTLFRLATSQVDYFENQCVSIGNQCDAFDRFDDMDLGRAEIMRPANTSDQCQQLCTQTIKAFICRSFTWNPTTGKCYLNSVNTFMVGGMDKLMRAPGLVYYQRNDCIDLKLECDTSAMTLNLRTNEPFRGRMYVRDDPSGCETVGRSSSTSLVSSLNIPFESANGLSRCATRELPSRYSSVVVVQQHPLIQRKSDRYIKVVCDFQTANKTITSTYNVVANPWTSTALINATSFAPKIKLRITDKYGSDITGAKLGDELYLRIEAETESVYDMVARSVLAKSGGTEESIVLIDKDGCPTDFRIFPPLKKLNRRTIIGKFDAFKFSSDVVVRFQVDVQFCLNQCPTTTCDNNLLLNAQQVLPQLLNGSPSASSGSDQVDQYTNMGSLLNNLQPQQSVAGASASAATSTTSSPTSSQQSSLDTTLETAPTTSSSTQAPYSSRTSAGEQHPHRHDHYTFSANRNYSNPPHLSGADFNHQMGRQPSLPANHPLPNIYLQNNSILSSLTNSNSQIFEPRMAPPNENQKLDNGQQVNSIDSNSPMADSDSTQASGTASGDLQQTSRRKRRSAEPIPEAPSHVPLQREIIVEGSSSSAAAAAATTAAQTNNPAKPSKRRHSKIHREGKKGDERADELMRQSAAANGQPAYETTATNGNNLDNNNNNLEQSSLLCTTKNSLVLASLAFCTIQFLTIALCVVTWFHKKDVIKFTVRQPSQGQRIY